jgi:hypothetical protein
LTFFKNNNYSALLYWTNYMATVLGCLVNMPFIIYCTWDIQKQTLQ